MTGPAIDLTKVRRETPGCESVLHLNNAGAALMPAPVLDAMINHLRLEAEIGAYEAAEHNTNAVDSVYESVARLIDCSPDEVAIVENATRAWDMAFYSIPVRPGDRLLTSMAEYGSNYIALRQVCRRVGATVEPIPNDREGQVSVEALKSMLDDRVRLVAITHVPGNGGLVNPIAEIGKVTRSAGLLYLVDACQSVGQMPVKVSEIGCDILSFTARKFLRGPRAIGCLYVKKELLEELEPPFLDLHAAQWVEGDRYEIVSNGKRFETWETNVTAKIGLATAIDYALEVGLDSIWERIRRLADQLRIRLAGIPRVRVRDLGRHRCGIVSFTVDGVDSLDVRRALSERHINVWVVLPKAAPLDMGTRSLSSVVRASIHYYNSEEELARFCRAVEMIAQ